MDIVRHMTKTSVDVDRDIAARAAAILGTDTLRDTIGASRREVVDAQCRLELIELLGDRRRFDFDASDAAWGADESVAAVTGQPHEWIVPRGTAD